MKVRLGEAPSRHLRKGLRLLQNGGQQIHVREELALFFLWNMNIHGSVVLPLSRNDHSYFVHIIHCFGSLVVDTWIRELQL